MSKQPLPIITAAQRSTEWHEQRKGRVTGSISGAILGLNPFVSPEQALRRMVRHYHNVESEFTGNIATEYGSLNEPIAQLDYTNKTAMPSMSAAFLSILSMTGLARPLMD